MGDPAEFEDWEVLHSSDAALFLAPDLKDVPTPFEEIEGEPNGSGGAIKSDYFALDSGELYAKRAASEGDSKAEGITICGNPSWVDPNSDCLCLEQAKGELGFAGTELPNKGSDGLHSNKSSDALSSLPGCEEGEPFLVEVSKREVGFEASDDGHQNSDENVALIEAVSGETEKFSGSKTGDEKDDELGSDESVKISDTTDLSVEMNDRNANLSHCEGEKRGIVGLKLPLDLLKFCVLRVKPVWSISIAAAIVGILILGKRLYKMKRKSRSIPLKVSIDDKKASQFMVRAVRLNEAFSMVRRVPIVRFPHPAGGVTPWPVLGLM